MVSDYKKGGNSALDKYRDKYGDHVDRLRQATEKSRSKMLQCLTKSVDTASAKGQDKVQISLKVSKETILKEQGVRLEELDRLFAACD